MIVCWQLILVICCCFDYGCIRLIGVFCGFIAVFSKIAAFFDAVVRFCRFGLVFGRIGGGFRCFGVRIFYEISISRFLVYVYLLIFESFHSVIRVYIVLLYHLDILVFQYKSNHPRSIS